MLSTPERIINRKDEDTTKERAVSCFSSSFKLGRGSSPCYQDILVPDRANIQSSCQQMTKDELDTVVHDRSVKNGAGLTCTSAS